MAKVDEKKVVAEMKNVIPRLPELHFTSPVNWQIERGQHWAVIGPNGAGKTLISDLLQKKHALKEGKVNYIEQPVSRRAFIKSISFKDIYSLTDYKNSYYQQRWHATQTDDIPLVEDLLRIDAREEYKYDLLNLFRVEDLLYKRLIYLSSGELRKFLIIRALLSEPDILVLDNPFIGLDASSRELLVNTLNELTVLKNVQIILLLSNPADIPDMVTHILPVYNRSVFSALRREDFLQATLLLNKLFPPLPPIGELPVDHTSVSTHKVTIRMENIWIKYGERTILKDLNWEVKNGEKWSLSGPNGSGKSTLLSLVYADNPQSYANTFYLFDKKRGSGESIWDIKKRIGYVSPEMHLYYMENVPALEIVGSGYFDSIGLHRSCNEEQRKGALEWMEVFGISQLKDRLFLSLSSGEQRLVLLARAFVKNPDLLVLDEPLHGLDMRNKQRVAEIIEKFCAQPGKTLIYVTHYAHELPPSVDNHFKLVKHS